MSQLPPSRARHAALALVGVSVAALSAPATLRAQAKTAPASASALVKGPSVEGITEYTLPANGLKVLLFPDPSKPQTTVNVTYLVGSKHEGAGEAGMAHLLEHLTFKGSPRHRSPAKELESHGASHNGTTSWDRTNYFETFPSADSTLAWALDLEADRMVNSFISKHDLETEFSVVRNEFEMNDNNPFRLTIMRTVASAFLFHPYGRDIVGSKSDIENVPIERLQGFYRKFYQPDNAVLTIAGSFDEKKVLQLVQEKFGRIARPARKLEPVYTVEPTQDGERTTVMRRVGDNAIALAYYHVPAGSHPDFAAIDVLTRVLGDAPSGRLYKALIETKKAAQVSGQNIQMHDPSGMFFLAMLRKSDNLDSAQSALLGAIAEAATSRPPTAEEVDRAKAALARNFQLTLSRSASLGLELSDWMAMGDWRLFFIHRDRVRNVTLKDVQRVANHYLKPSNRTLALFIPTDVPDRTEIAAAPSIDSLVRNYKGEAAVAAGEAFDPTPENVEGRVKRSTLPSGMKLALLSKKTRAEAVTAIVNLRFGTEQSLAGRAHLAPMVASMLMRGTTTHTRQQIRDSLDRMKAVMGVGGSSSGSVTVSITAARATLPAVLRLAGEVLRQPAFDAAELEALRNESVASIESQRTDPQALALNGFQRWISGYPAGHPRYVPTLDERLAQVKAVTADDLRKFHADFLGASNGEIAVVGDFDPAEITKVATEVFGSWKSPAPFKPVPNVLHVAAAGKQSIETPDKANAFFIAGQPLALRDADPEYPALLLGNYMIGGTALASRLATRIRQKEGLSYAVQTIFNAGQLDPYGQFFGVAIFNPANADKVDAAFFDELRKATAEGFTADEVEKAKAGLLQERKLARSNDSALASALTTGLFVGRTMRYDADLDRKIAALTPAQVQAALGKAIDPAKMAVIRAGDFAKTKLAGQPKP